MEKTTNVSARAGHSAPECMRDDGLATTTLQDLPHLSREQMGRLWEQLLRTPVPKSLSLPLMVRFVAFELQAQDQGGLPGAFVEGLARKVADDAGRGKASPARLRPGGRLLREWNGTTHVVDIVEGGFVWRGATHASLSAIAREITGAHWSGPRFFGLTAPAGAGGGPRTTLNASRTTRGAR